MLRWFSPQVILHNSTTVKQLHRLALYQLYEEMIHSWIVGVPGILFQGVSSSYGEKKAGMFFLLLLFYFILAQEFLNSRKYGVNLKL